MPRGDRTGPQGEGPMTGRQLGYGAGYDSPGYTKGGGRGMGRGFFGRGFGRGFFGSRPPVAPEEIRQAAPPADEMGAVKSEVHDLKNTLSSILDRLNKLIPEKKADK